MSTPPSPAHNMPPPTTDLTIPCLFIDSGRKISHGDAFSVRVQPNATIEGLKEAVKEKRPDVLEHVVPASLAVWRCKDPKLLTYMELEELEEALSKVDFTNKKKAYRPGIGRKIATLDLSEDEILLVQLPASPNAIPPSERPFVVYMPAGSDSHPTLIHIPRGNSVDTLKNHIRAHVDFEESVGRQKLHLYQCGTIRMLPTQPDSGEGPMEKCYKEVVEWLHGKRTTDAMLTHFLLEHYFKNGPSPENGTIDVIAVTDSLLKGINRNVVSDDFKSNSLIKQLTFSVNGPFSAADWCSIVDRNGFGRSGELPLFISSIVKRLRREPADDNFAVFNTEAIGVVLRNILSDANDALPYKGWYLEILHYVNAFALEKTSQLGELTEYEAHAIVLGSFKRYWMDQVEDAGCTFRKELKFPFLAEEFVDGESRGLRKYWPQPDAAFLKNNFPRFLVEIDSHSNDRDCYRLQVQAACTLRFASQLRKDDSDGVEDKELFLMAAYFTKGWVIHRYFFFFDDKNEKVLRNEELYQVTKPHDLTKFLIEFYNYSRHVQDLDKLGDKRQSITSIVKEIDGEVQMSLHTKDINGGGKKRKNPDADHGPGAGKRLAMSYALRAAGYVVGPQNDGRDRFEPIVKLPDNLVEATAPDGEVIVAKLPRKNSEELSLLQELSHLKSPHNHVIPLFGTVESILGPLIILPSESSLSSDYLLGVHLKSESVRLCHELVEGVAFLHRRKIAHLDIKPGNLVYSFKSARLYIIDFGISMRCKDVEDMVEISCGTPEWSAPEIVLDDDERPRAFSPIRADLWSCGKVLEHILKRTSSTDKTVALLVKLLMDSDPRRRPLVHEMVEEKRDFWDSGHLSFLLRGAQGGKVQKVTVADGVRSKRARHHASGDCWTSEVIKKARFSKAQYPAQFSLSSSPQSSSGSSQDSSLDTPLPSEDNLAQTVYSFPAHSKKDMETKETELAVN